MIGGTSGTFHLTGGANGDGNFTYMKSSNNAVLILNYTSAGAVGDNDTMQLAFASDSGGTFTGSQLTGGQVHTDFTGTFTTMGGTTGGSTGTTTGGVSDGGPFHGNPVNVIISQGFFPAGTRYGINLIGNSTSGTFQITGGSGAGTYAYVTSGATTGQLILTYAGRDVGDYDNMMLTFATTDAGIFVGRQKIGPNSEQNLAGSFVLGSSTRPLNDNFTQRLSLSGAVSIMNGSNENATKESSEPTSPVSAGGKSVWWTWTAPTDGTVTVDTVGSSFDTTLAVYTGNSLSTLINVASDDDSGGQRASRLSFMSAVGMSYQIVVDGNSGASGSIVLKLVSTVFGTSSAPSSISTLNVNNVTGPFAPSQYTIKLTGGPSGTFHISGGANGDGTFSYIPSGNNAELILNFTSQGAVGDRDTMRLAFTSSSGGSFTGSQLTGGAVHTDFLGTFSYP